MAAEVESMFSVREVPWHGLGTIVSEAPNSAEAIELAGLDWEVQQEKICREKTGEVIKGIYGNFRQTDGSCLGYSTDRYRIIQNDEIFSFTDELIGSGDVKYETAGSLKGGKRVWLLAKMPKRIILEDEVEPYVCFVNSHDCKGAVRVCMTPIRVVCNNTLNLALKGAKKNWQTKHTGDLKGKLEEAKRTLGFANYYLDELDKAADVLVNTSITEDEVRTVVYNLFPTSPLMSERAVANMENYRTQLLKCMEAPDIAKFKGTQWGVIQGVADYMTHSVPNRKSATFEANRFENILSSSNSIVDKTLKLMGAAV